jgi:hypothetical protein
MWHRDAQKAAEDSAEELLEKRGVLLSRIELI